MYKTLQKLTGLFLAALMLGLSVPVFAASDTAGDVTRSETVYVDTDAYGNPQSIISSVYLTNGAGTMSLTDHTNLENIKNVGGKEKPVLEDGAVTFLTPDGADICYQGISNEALPFSVHISYTLDGVSISAEDIAGKSGTVGITVQSVNNTHCLMEVEGELLELYTPFSIICMMSLNSGYANVISDNAKISVEAGVITILAVMNPGLQQSLDAEEGYGLHDSFTVSLEADNFELDSVMFIGMTGILDAEDLSGIDSVQELIDALDTLNVAAGELYSGSLDLADGVTSYVRGMKTIANSMQSYYAGMKEFAEGMQLLADGAVQVSGGVSQLNAYVQQLMAAYNSIKAIFGDTGSLASELVGQIESSIGIPLSELASGTDLAGAVYAAIAEALGMSESSLAELDSTIQGFASGINELAWGASELASGTWQATLAAEELAEGAQQLSEGLDSLYSASRTLSKAIAQMSEGLGSLQEEGLQAVVDETSGISSSLSRKDLLIGLANEYNAFSSTDPNVVGSVQFILSTAAIRAEKPLTVPASTEGGTETAATGADAKTDDSFLASLWDSIRNWFHDAGEWIKGIFA